MNEAHQVSPAHQSWSEQIRSDLQLLFGCQVSGGLTGNASRTEAF